MDNYSKYVQYGLNWNRNVGNSRRSYSETAFETILIVSRTLPTLYFKTISPPIRLLKTVIWDVHQPSSYSSSAFCHFIRPFFFLFSLMWKAPEH